MPGHRFPGLKSCFIYETVLKHSPDHRQSTGGWCFDHGKFNKKLSLIFKCNKCLRNFFSPFFYEFIHNLCSFSVYVWIKVLWIFHNIYPWNVLLVFLSLAINEARRERTDTQIKGTDRHKNPLWSLTCANWLFLLALIRNCAGACLKSVSVLSTLSLLTHLEAVCSFSFFFLLQAIHFKVSARNDVPLNKSVTGHGSSTIDIFRGWGLGGQWAGEDLRISFVLPGQGLTMWPAGSKPDSPPSLDTGQIWLD